MFQVYNMHDVAMHHMLQLEEDYLSCTSVVQRSVVCMCPKHNCNSQTVNMAFLTYIGFLLSPEVNLRGVEISASVTDALIFKSIVLYEE